MVEFIDGYTISRDGVVKSLDYNNTGVCKELKQDTFSGGYKRITVCVGGKIKKHSIHRLVAVAFVPNPENKPCVNHIDNDTSNNCVDNLEWCTHSENMIHAVKQGRLSEVVNEPKIVRCIETGEEFFSGKEAYRATGIDASSINRVCNGIRKSAGGYRWEYV